ncbi:MAG: hhaIM [Gammaproteobacteria bacterium]|jgi:DNA (cytosine-5)-methyltransferase 1|nr:hhaIM [Gammaproteobacteria bacterium]
MTKTKIHLDLFSGIGGFALAAQKIGYKTIGFCEIDTFCKKVLAKNFPDVPIYSDIKKLNFITKVDLLTGGFPCQPFSQAGNKKGRDDERYLWPEFKRIIHESEASWIIIENVYGIISMGLDNILLDLEKEGYTAEQFVLPACAAFAPHRRDQLWVIAYRNSFGSHKWASDWKKRYLQKDKDGYMEKIQQKWVQFIPHTWTSLNARKWIHYNAQFGRRNNGLSNKLDKNRIKAIGNAVVPQVIYPILQWTYDHLCDS